VPEPEGPDCRYLPAFLSDPDALFATMRDEVPWTQQMRSRRTASMGVPYNYAGARYPVAEWHPAVAALLDRLEGQVGFRPTNCLLNYYPTGRHSLGWHADEVGILAPGTGIAILSLGVARVLRLRTETADGFHYDDRVLAPGSLLHMTAAMQADWKHALRRAPTDEPRISLTFRHIVVWESHPEPLAPQWGR
jgi:alkylated DNA repair dioxygenase AlkB